MSTMGEHVNLFFPFSFVPWRSIVGSISYHFSLYTRRVWVFRSASTVVSRGCHAINAYKGTCFWDTLKMEKIFRI
jgi:hypothetical protein